MKVIISATIRSNSRTLQVSKIVESIYKDLGEEACIMDLKSIPFEDMMNNPYEEGKIKNKTLQKSLDQLAKAEALIIVCPEYNGGVPGPIKHFIDHWKHPESFVFKPICFVGLGGRFGALKPISQLQDIFIYRQSFVFPIRVLIQNVQHILKGDKLDSEDIMQALKTQAKQFSKFVKHLQSISFDS